MADRHIQINRAPVLTLWAAIVAERLGHDREAALTLGKALAGLNAQSKGRRLGIFEDKPAEEKEKPKKQIEQTAVTLLGRAVPAVRTKQGLRALAKDEAVDPASVEKYLRSKFGADLDEARLALETLAKSRPKDRLDDEAFRLYEQFRPSVPEGEKGWGARGVLDLAKILAMAKK